MITSYKQALAIQTRRVEANRRGYAKAVRRYFLHHHPDHYKTIKDQLPVLRPKPKNEQPKRKDKHQKRRNSKPKPVFSPAGVPRTKEAA